MNPWMHKRKVVLSSVPALWLGLALWTGFGFFSARAATFTASLDRDTITLGETATLSLTFENGSPRKVPMPPDTPGLDVAYVTRSTQYTSINGQNSSTATYIFTLKPQRTGEFIIPSLTAYVDGQQMTSPALKLTVLAANAPTPADVNSGNQVAFMTFKLSKDKVYVGEALTGELRVFLRDDVQNAHNFQVTGVSANGFTMGTNWVQGTQDRIQIHNRVYTVVPFNIALTAAQAGSMSIGPVTATIVLTLPSSNGSDNGFFPGFFNPFGVRKQFSLTTDTLDVQALPVPTDNAPKNFNGAVGDYTMRVTAGPTNVAVGDPITVRVEISGRGDLDALTLPDQPDWQDFKIYPPTSKLDLSDRLGIEGKKTFEEIVSPDSTDVHQLPEFSFSFFDPDTKSFHTLTQPPLPLAVKPGGTVTAPVVASAQPTGAEAPPPPDIFPLKQQLGAPAEISLPLVTRPWFLAAQSVPVLAWLAAFVWRKRADNLANNPRLRRQRRVAQLVDEGLNELRRFAAENNPDEFFSALHHLLQEQLGERLDCPAFSITEAVIEEKLRPLGAPESTIAALHELFQTCDQARYAPIRGSRELAAVAAQFETVTRELRNLKA
jgi:BatD DUF11 like domain